MAVEDLWTNRLRTRLKVYILQGICEAEFNSVTPRVCVESTFRLGCEGSVDHKEQWIQRVGAWAQENKNRMQLSNHFSSYSIYFKYHQKLWELYLNRDFHLRESNLPLLHLGRKKQADFGLNVDC